MLSKITDKRQVGKGALLFNPTTNQWFRCSSRGKMRDLWRITAKPVPIREDGRLYMVGYLQTFLYKLGSKARKKIMEG